MSYERDKDMMLRGVGAIAAIDARNPKRARQRAMRHRVMSRIDGRRAQLAFGPGRKLPVRMGSLGAVPSKLLSTIGASAVSSNSVVYDPRAIQNMAIVKPSGGIVSAPVTQPVFVDPGGGTFQTYPETQAPKLPTMDVTPSAAGARPSLTVSGGGGGGGGGGGAGVVIGTPLPTIDVPEPTLEIPPESSGMSTSTKVAIGVGVLGLLYFITRDR